MSPIRNGSAAFSFGRPLGNSSASSRSSSPEEISRALAGNPKFLLLDEPFAGIDPIAVGDIQEIVRKLKSQNIGILITDHNVRETLGICDRAHILKDGHIEVAGTAEEIANSPLARKFYLGENFRL